MRKLFGATIENNINNNEYIYFKPQSNPTLSKYIFIIVYCWKEIKDFYNIDGNINIKS